ncbi:MAG: hypothetical protein LQ340_003562 [Diploschistes diacapsis]|nr:MAG: hypothetical protein LQ340_003562 [Diploschistes diacapsis]
MAHTLLVQTPQATPKQMTDEELRQQYGIQLASRPIDNGDGKEAKWADIDDDEDDWAPETIEWNDGTKINLATVDASTPTTDQLAALEKPKEIKPESTDSKSVPSKVNTIGPKATVLKLGSVSQPKMPSAEPVASATKPTVDKPTLVAKPSPAPPPKNPWAPLPPVDKFPPVASPVQQPLSAMGQREPPNFQGMPPPPPPPPAKEIAADDFSRFPREAANGTPRELFNSQSGRYEPVAERRMSKKDQGFRTPSVLQRPLQTDPSSPAEPSPAFQTSRSQQDASQWRRRRASSNISGENGAFLRRMSVSKSSLDGVQRRDSQLEQPMNFSAHHTLPDQQDTSPVSQEQSFMSQSPIVSTAQTVPSDQSFMAQASPTPATPATSATPGGHTVEEVKMQKVLMKEKAEAAHRRRLEEEQRQEAEKRERLRLKMEQMGLTDAKMGKKVVEEEATPSPNIILKDVKASPASVPPPPVKAVSPPKPPIPTANGEPQQYGLMKVHAPQVITPTSPSFEKKLVNPGEITRDTTSETKPSTMREPASIVAPMPQTNGEQIPKKPSPAPIGAQLNKEETIEYPSQRLTPVPPSVNGHTAWGQHSMVTHSTPGGNVWAAPANHKGLGNGDFQKRVHVAPTQQPFPPQHLVSSQPQPQPIGTPRQQTNNKPIVAEAPIVSLPSHVNVLPQSHAFSADTSILSSERPKMHLPHPTTSQSQLPISPDTDIPSASSRNMMPQMSQREMPLNGMAIWNDFSKNAAAYDTKSREKMDQEHAALMIEQQKTGKPLSTGPVYNETWKQVVKGQDVGARNLVSSVKTQREFSSSETAPAAQAPAPVRSRYQDIFEQNERSFHHHGSLVQSILPPSPPAEVELHPVFGSTQRPVVNLPGSKVRDPDALEGTPQRPIVRLPPPKALTLIGAPATVEPRLSLSPLRAQPFVANPTWQDRINGLFDRKAAAADRKPLDTTDFSISKPPLELLSAGSTSVTLPPKGASAILRPEIPLKTVEEEDALFEERDFGSVPTVRVPAMAPPLAWNPAKPYANWKRMRAVALGDGHIYSGFNFIPGFDDLARQADIPVVIRLAGMMDSKTKPLARTGNFKQTRQPYNNSLRRKPNHGHKGREQSLPLGSTPPGQLNTGRQNGQQAGGQRKASGNIGQTWARRVSGVVQ